MTDKQLYFRVIPHEGKFLALVKEKNGVVVRLGSRRTERSAMALVRSYGYRHETTMINKDTGAVATGPMVLDQLGKELPDKRDAGSVVERKIEDV